MLDVALRYVFIGVLAYFLAHTMLFVFRYAGGYFG